MVKEIVMHFSYENWIMSFKYSFIAIFICLLSYLWLRAMSCRIKWLVLLMLILLPIGNVICFSHIKKENRQYAFEIKQIAQAITTYKASPFEKGIFQNKLEELHLLFSTRDTWIIMNCILNAKRMDRERYIIPLIKLAATGGVITHKEIIVIHELGSYLERSDLQTVKQKITEAKIKIQMPFLRRNTNRVFSTYRSRGFKYVIFNPKRKEMAEQDKTYLTKLFHLIDIAGADQANVISGFQSKGESGDSFVKYQRFHQHNMAALQDLVPPQKLEKIHRKIRQALEWECDYLRQWQQAIIENKSFEHHIEPNSKQETIMVRHRRLNQEIVADLKALYPNLSKESLQSISNRFIVFSLQ